ncbi:hypothetical protein [Methylomarinum vadi]|uniref:hypothetical protein n=1 Tax=Methylomarinum vadi TaxID=438855 RepID=UPI0004DF00F2|nr:hypothetical protein [Methylomarinum vadi]
MRVFTRSFLLLLIMLSLASCKRALKPEEIPAHIVIGDTYYTQFVIRYEKGVHLTTNFRRGAAIPVNTPVKLLGITSKTIEVEVDDSKQTLLVKNVEKHTGDDVFAAFDKLFGKRKINLAKFTRLERQHIKSGTVAKGMRKNAVVVAIGYPPVTETMNLDSDLWVYWSGRFNKFNVYFKNGKVSRIED